MRIVQSNNNNNNKLHLHVCPSYFSHLNFVPLVHKLEVGERTQEKGLVEGFDWLRIVLLTWCEWVINNLKKRDCFSWDTLWFFPGNPPPSQRPPTLSFSLRQHCHFKLIRGNTDFVCSLEAQKLSTCSSWNMVPLLCHNKHIKPSQSSTLRHFQTKETRVCVFLDQNLTDRSYAHQTPFRILVFNSRHRQTKTFLLKRQIALERYLHYFSYCSITSQIHFIFLASLTQSLIKIPSWSVNAKIFYLGHYLLF